MSGQTVGCLQRLLKEAEDTSGSQILVGFYSALGLSHAIRRLMQEIREEFLGMDYVEFLRSPMSVAFAETAQEYQNSFALAAERVHALELDANFGGVVEERLKQIAQYLNHPLVAELPDEMMLEPDT